MEMKDIRALQTAEIEAKLDEARTEQFKLRFQFRGGQLTDYTRLAAGRRTIARLLTVLRERELAAQLAAKGEQA
ncbi:MAG: 50S ribosomal protein L29 [Anaerolineales bacterium]|nr:50S ribosomal protein L29 [Anaerolineales bacterium]